MWDSLQTDDVVLADRGFCSYADLYLLKQRGVESVMRQHARRTTGVKEIKRLDRRDRLVHWIRTGMCPTWLEKSLWETIPETLCLREITFSSDI